MRKTRYIIFVSRDHDGRLRKIPIPLRYAYVFIAAALVGLFTITGLAGSYSRMLLKTARFDQVRTEREAMRKDYLRMERLAHEKDVQAASLGSLAGEISALYGLRESRLAKASAARASSDDVSSDISSDGASDRQYYQSLNQFIALRSSALSGEVARQLDFAIPFPLGPVGPIDMANAPSVWPIEGRVTSSFGERQDPLEGEGAFHTGIDIAAEMGDPVRATADGAVLKAGLGDGYGREIILDHGHNIETLYAHLSGYAVTAGEDVHRGDIIGYVGSSGRSTGPHLHYEVRIGDTPVNPHKFLPGQAVQFANAGSHPTSSRGGY